MALFAVLVFTTAGSVHFQTPLLPELSRTFSADAATVGLVPTLSFAGFLLGTLLLTPLGDTMDRRMLILGKVACLAVAVIVMAAAPTLPVLIAAGFVVGVAASVSQDLVPLVADLAAPGERGRAVGTLLSGLFLGILLGRLGGGLIAAWVGWRWTYIVDAVLILAILPIAFLRIPSTTPRVRLRYGALMRSLVELMRARADLRRASIVQFLLGTCYTAFWATIAQMLFAVHGLGPAYAGLVGIPGAAGILVARPAGRMMDRVGARPVVTAGVATVVAAYLVFGLASTTVIAAFVGAALLDSGLRASMVANQALITGADAETRARSNTVFAVLGWGGYSVGAYAGTIAWTQTGWLGVCATGVLLAVGALGVYRAGRG